MQANQLRLDAITLDAGSGAFTLGDANTNNITLGTAGGQTHTWTNNSANAAAVSVTNFATGGGGTHTLALTGSGNWNFNNATTLAGAIPVNVIGSGAVNLNGSLTAASNTAINVSSTTSIPVLNLASGSTLALTGGNGSSILVANLAGSSRGVVNQSGGIITSLTGNLLMGGAAGTVNYAFYNKTAGDISQASVNRFRIGQASGAGSAALFYNLGGNITTNVGIALNDTAGAVVGPGGASVLYVTDGIVTGTAGAVGSNTVGLGIGGRGGQSEVTIAGTGSVVLNSRTSLGGSVAGTPAAADAGRVAVLNLGTGSVGGSLQTSNVFQNTNAAALGYLNFNGGTLKSQTANAAFMTGLTRATVLSGGGTIDNNGVDITIGQALLAPTGSGVTSIGVSAAGSGYVRRALRANHRRRRDDARHRGRQPQR